MAQQRIDNEELDALLNGGDPRAQAGLGEPEAPALGADGPVGPGDEPIDGPGLPPVEVTDGPVDGNIAAPQEEVAPSPVAAGGLDASTYQPQMSGDEVMQPKFSRKLPRISGMLEPSQMYQEGSADGGTSSLIEAILAALQQQQ
jgi:hypothetical protein